MLHTKFCGNQPTGSREDFLPYVGVEAILVMGPKYRDKTFNATFKGGSKKNL